ncbi:MAG: hypothetical protein M1817_000172 [Caeruleum heppii]|nr:MAG: hypothetical protein M1817_000172 [Caeruleum heppii]
MAANASSVTGGSSAWSLKSWRTKPIKQQVTYDDPIALQNALAKLTRLPPLVTPTEICRLKSSLRDVALGHAFLLQGGDCAELFDYCEEGAINSKIKLLLQMSLVLIWGANKPVVRIARMAGQFAKPRSSPTETIDGKEIPSFRGDNINGFDLSERTPDPSRLVSAYFHSASTLNYLRAQIASGIADLHSPLDWNLGHVQSASIKARYQRIVSSITDSLRFMRTVGADTAGQLKTVDLYTSHEGLLLEYEETLTRQFKHPPNRLSALQDLTNLPSSIQAPPQQPPTGWYNTSAHFLWIGDRTRHLSGAHVEYFRGLENPIGIKVGPSMQSDELVQLLDLVNPHREIGKVTLITRYGQGRVRELLGDHIEAVQRSDHVVIWQCDPMHGNTHTSTTGLKTRSFAAIHAELAQTFAVHAAHGSHLGGVHLELTGEPVTECTGGSEGLTDDDLLGGSYTTFCDPRLNEKQALELAFLVAENLRGDGGERVEEGMGKGNV